MEGEDEEMCVEEGNRNIMRKLGLRNTIQTNFGEDYVFQIASSQEIPAMAVSLSTNIIKLYSPETGQYLGDCKGHSNTIHEISFSVPSSPYILHSCSSDGTIRGWDTRIFKQVSLLRGASSQEIFSFSFEQSSGNLLAAGCNSQILFWDWRNSKALACLEDSHVDDVIQVKFVPEHKNRLISASVDGLLCIFDTEGDINDENQLDSVMNVGTSIAKVGLFGDRSRKLWCLTHIETLSVWDWEDSLKEVDFQDARTLASDSWNLGHVDYFVDCHYNGADDKLWVIGGTNDGTLGYFPVNYKNPKAICSPDAVLEGGHSAVVRTILPSSAVHMGSVGSFGSIFGWTGGEDGRLCCWLSDESAQINPSWISNSLVMKSSTNQKRHRHHPYH
ncbi:WD repeat-containing protein GTS1 isoform X2 [Nymphaea colorata]|uniref:WD repeat-containing protein GTS1 isoform X2 n=1 Tax=Nymphaea colorata TaxID=210225 RepID=UPI00129DD56E|nr:WD repeat-containing protein GTS1 isoform X2 [Nymphaea colorata]